ncbi:carbohydrate-binding protein, partial [Acinetobacter baumannii]
MDVAKYANGCKTLENCIVTIQGGAMRRPGTRFIGEVKSSLQARLISFVYSRSQAYVILMGGGYLWFYKNRARIGSYEAAS